MIECSKYKLSECCLSISDGDHLPPPKVDAGIPFITISDIDSSNRLNLDVKQFVPEEYYNNLKDIRKAQRNDILYSVVGSFGIPVIIKGNDKFAFQRHIAILRPDPTKVIPDYLFYIMKTYGFYMQADSVAIGAAQRTISLTALRNMTVELPSMDVQKKIATTLSRYDSLIDNYQKQIKLLEEAAQRLYKEWFVNLRFPGHENTKIVDGVPEGWEKKTLGDVFSFVRGKSYTSKELSNSGIVMVNLKNIASYGGYKRNAEKYFTGIYKQNQSLLKGDLVMGVTDMTKERRLVGHVAMVPYLSDMVTFTMDLIKLLPFDLPNSFVYAAMRFGGISQKISPLANGVNVLHLKPEAIMDIEFVEPQRDLVDRYSHFAENTFEEVWKLEAQIDKLTESRDRLLPKLLSGEIEV